LELPEIFFDLKKKQKNIGRPYLSQTDQLIWQIQKLADYHNEQKSATNITVINAVVKE
jgi:hypothetical protein